MNKKHFYYVSTLAKELSFSRAAEVLGISQPTLSQCIRKIERGLELQLFIRNGLDVRLSEAGEKYLQYARDIQEIEKKMEDSFLKIRQFKTGNLKIALSPSKCYTLMPAIVKRFRERYPGIRVLIQEQLAGDLLKGLDDGTFDFGVTPMPQDLLHYHCDVIMQEEIIVAVPSDMPVCKELQESACAVPGRSYPAIDFTELNSAPFIVMQDWQIMQKQLLDLCEQCKIVICPVVECTNNLTMITMVQNGVGISLIPNSMISFAESMGKNNITYFSLIQNVPNRDIVCIYKKGRKLTEPAMFMVKLLKEMGK